MIKDLQVNQEQCIGCGLCETTCPSRFRLTYKVQAEVRGADVDKHRSNVVEAYRSCPVQAIELSSDDPSLMAVWHAARLSSKSMLTPTSMMEVRLDSDLSSYKPGQHITVRMRDAVGFFNRAYSIVDLQDGVLTLCVSLVEGGRASAFFLREEVGASLEVTDPKGDFCLKETNRSKLFVGTGSGLAPLISMMEACPDVQKTLYFGQRNEQELFYLERLSTIPNLNVVIGLDAADDDWAGARGRVTDLVRETSLARETEVYTCGSDAMMNDLEKVLKKKRHPRRSFFKESFSNSYSPVADEGRLSRRRWIRNIHIYTSLLFSMLFLFFGLSGFLASRPELFPIDARQMLPANIAIEKGELGGFYKAQFGEDFSLTDYRSDDDYSTVELQNSAKVVLEVEVDNRNRSYMVTEYHPLPPELAGLDAEALATQLAKQLKGKLDVEGISEDEDLIYFSLNSVWLNSMIKVDRTKEHYEIGKDPVPLAKTLILIHKGKEAASIQRIMMDATAWAMVIATLTGMIMIFQSTNPKVRFVATVLIGLSVVIFVVMTVNR